MKKINMTGILIVFCFSFTYQIHAQRFLNKIQNRTEDKILDEIFKEGDGKKETTENQETSRSATSNTRGEGLTASAIDVNENIDAASAAYKSENYSNSRIAVRKALQGIELEIGMKVLASLPESVVGLSKSEDADRVTSTGINFTGLTIERAYTKGDQELRLVIANNSAWLSAVNMYISNGGAATTDEQQNYKQIRFQGYQGVIEYDEGSGYKLSVPFGQSSVFVLNGINFSNEQQMMSAADKFNLENIRKQLGEQ
jgi:hypothetical protein